MRLAQRPPASTEQRLDTHMGAASVGDLGEFLRIASYEQGRSIRTEGTFPKTWDTYTRQGANNLMHVAYLSSTGDLITRETLRSDTDIERPLHEVLAQYERTGRKVERLDRIGTALTLPVSFIGAYAGHRMMRHPVGAAAGLAGSLGGLWYVISRMKGAAMLHLEHYLQKNRISVGNDAWRNL